MSLASDPGAPEGEPADARIARHAWIFLVAAALVSGLYFHLQYRRHNAAPEVDLSAFADGPRAGFLVETEYCVWTPRKIAVVGWIARRGVGGGRRQVRAVFVDRQGRGFALKTSLRDREDVSARLNQRFGDQTRYRNAGFTASVSLPTANLAPEGADVVLAYDDGEVRAVFPLACAPGSGRP